MSFSNSGPFHPAPHRTALWLARLSIGLLIGSALWLMGVRVYENKVCVDTFRPTQGQTGSNTTSP
jgi:hypothetical protein